ncbi:glycosyltransferase family A protein [Polynucleobacter sp. UB-Tiil-W10]|uniref:glycosyltransferase family A protein n=1 Tax=Polynucleobacter sp. UB-Tiil-W10 TaxID=1855648 RepID=UPI001C0C7DC0|nr:glycosyltransferase family A protein [Polynucleobacter sp. UB-Tiil-W10]MBU3540804.1 glycosyltransferase family 2 protein [Polynucleobacter sp. UB-Tiil-W10]
MPAPIALFVYNRPDHFKKVVESLLVNPESKYTDLIIFSDGAKSDADTLLVNEVRAVAENITGFKSSKVEMQNSNLGLSRSIISGVTKILSTYDQIIVIEDDLIVAPYFLKFMNEGLSKYKDDDRVISIHGYVYPTENILPENFFLRGADCWGWATWKRGWKLFNENGSLLIRDLKSNNLISQFDFNGAYPFSKMLADQIRGRNDSWAVKWYASAFLANRVTLYPGKSLIQNMGFDGMGVHCSPTQIFDVDLTREPVELVDIPVISSEIAFGEFEKFYRRSKRSFLTRLLAKIKMILFK